MIRRDNSTAIEIYKRILSLPDDGYDRRRAHRVTQEGAHRRAREWARRSFQQRLAEKLVEHDERYGLE